MLCVGNDNVCITEKSKGLWSNCVLFTSRSSKCDFNPVTIVTLDQKMF